MTLPDPLDPVCRRTMDRLLEGCQVIGQDFRYLYVNDTLAAQARQPASRLVGRTMMEAYPGIEQTPAFAAIRRVMDGGAAEHFDNFFEFPDGTSGWFELSIQPVPDGVCVLSIDITARVEAQRLAHRQQRLESLGTLAGGVAHDVNNALAPILMSVGLIRELEGTPDPDLVSSIEDSAARAARLVRQLLTFSKGSDSPLVPVRPEAIIHDVKRFIDQAFPKNIRTRFELPQQVPGILGDATQLSQVLLNLCINARDAMPEGGDLTIAVNVAHIDEAYAAGVMHGRPGRFVTITVRDSGTGIPPDVMDRIFEPFFTTKGPDLGTGLGLSTSLGIVRGHGGFVHVYSVPNRGTTFRVFLPLASQAEAADTDPDRPLDIRGDQRGVLVVDDDDRSREAAGMVLGRLGFSVTTARGGAEALVRLVELGPSVAIVLLDLHMPGMDGRTCYARLRALRPSLPIVIMTGSCDGADDADSPVADPVLAKPFTRADLVAALRQALPSQR